MSIRAVLFDFGGVFTDSPFGALAAAAVELGAAPEDVLEIVFGPYDHDTDHPWHRLERGELPLSEAREAIIALGAARDIALDPIQLLVRGLGGKGAREAVVAHTRRLRADGLRTALVTNNAREFREGWRSLLPLDELFDAVVDSSEVGVRKPDPAIFELALREIGDVEPQAAVFLDDFHGNVAAARRVGMHGLLVEDDPSGALRELDRLLRSRP